MTAQQLQAMADIEREILVSKVTGVDTKYRQQKIYHRLSRKEMFEVACAIIDKFRLGSLGGYNLYHPEVTK